MEWTDARKIRLKALWADGLSLSEIAARFGDGATRGTISGKIYRMGLKPRTVLKRTAIVRRLKTTSFRAPPKPRSPLQRLRNLPGYQAPPAVDPRKRGTVPLTDLEPHQCRFAAGDPGPGEKHLFCGKLTMPSFPYCEEHVHRCYQIDKPRSTGTSYRGLRPLSVANVFVPA